jgi:hypothetical protein
MRVPPLRFGWLLRLLVILCLGALALLALSAPAGVVAPAPLATLPPTALVRPRPTQTPQLIVSIIQRETPPPFPTSTPTPVGQPAVSIVDFSYMPGILRITAGQSVVWRNDGTEQHDVTGIDWHSGPLDPTATYRLTFGTVGTYEYRCTIHLDMTGRIIVSS